MQEGSGVPNLQTELNYLDSFKSYCNFSDLDFLVSGGWGWMVVRGGWGWGWVDGGGGWLEVPPTCTHTCACMHTHAHTCIRGKHDNFMQVATSIGGIHGNSL